MIAAAITEFHQIITQRLIAVILKVHLQDSFRLTHCVPLSIEIIVMLLLIILK